MTLQVCKDFSEAQELHKGYRLYLLPVARMNITVQLPSGHKAVSPADVQDRLHTAVRPDAFQHLRLLKSGLDFLRFEAELETRSLLPKVKQRLDNRAVKLPACPDLLRVRACAAKPTEPGRHDWDAFFRDAEDMDEMKPGERPDTIHLQRLPTRWFCDAQTAHGLAWPLPSEAVLRTVFSVFGEVRSVHIPATDRFQLAERTCVANDGTFEAFVQFMEYVCFVRAMDAFRGAKLLRMEEGQALTTNVTVDFDRTKHLSEKSIRRRQLLQQKMEEEQKAKESARRAEEERRRRELDSAERQRQREKKEGEKEERRRQREEKRRRKHEERRRREEEQRMKEKIAMEERKILIAMRRLEAIRLLSELLRRVKVRRERAQARRERGGEKRQRRRETALRERILQTMSGSSRKKEGGHKRRKEAKKESPAKRSRSG